MITLDRVTKAYRKGVPAVNELSLRIPEAQTTVLVGPSGCGKTTTLRMINRMIEPTTGSITWDDVPLLTLKRTLLRRRMGYVIQSGGLFPHRTVADNIATVPQLLRWDKRRTASRIDEVMDLVGLDEELATRYPAELSGGQQQRVGVARALAGDPEVLLMDEPFSAVDPVVRGELQQMVKNLQQQVRKTIVMITHDIDEALTMGDQVAVLNVGGKLEQSGRPRELLDEPANDFVSAFVGRDRGYRSLGFVPAEGLQPTGVRTATRPPSPPATEPVLVLDEDGRPRGWADPGRPGEIMPLGGTFEPGAGTMRAALDAALTSPVGLAVAVAPATGRFAGVVSVQSVVTAVQRHRRTHAMPSEQAGDATRTASQRAGASAVPWRRGKGTRA